MRPHPWKTAAPVALILLSGLVLAGCGDDAGGDAMPGMSHGDPPAASSSPAAQAGDFNDADVTFATQMIPHHQQAVQMAEHGRLQRHHARGESNSPQRSRPRKTPRSSRCRAG